MANQVALLAGLKLLADGIKDVEKALEPGQSLVERIADLKELVPDAIEAVKAGGVKELKAEIEALQPSDYVSLAGVLVSDIGIENEHAKKVVEAGLKLLGDVAGDIKPFIDAVQNKPAQ